MKKTMRKRMLSILMLVCLLFAICATPASAYTFSFNFPSSDQTSSSMRSTSFSYQSKGATPYVSTNVTTISTLYFMSPSRLSSTNATNIVYITSKTTKNFTWRSGYGGVAMHIISLVVRTPTMVLGMPIPLMVLGDCKAEICIG